jgi:hypothetical protein
MTVKPDKVRKLVTLDKEMWEQIADYRFAARLGTESEAIRSLLGMGLLKMREMLDAIPKGKVGKKK